MFYIELIFLGISLSIDAFTLAMSVSLLNKIKCSKNTYSLVVGLYHFLMPILGYILKKIINSFIVLPEKNIFIIVLIFIIVGILVDKEEKHISKLVNPLIFGFSVSIDSFTIGISLLKEYVIISSIIFSLISSFFTYLGFYLGNKLSNKFQNFSKIISIVILLVLLLLNIL